ncbi:putative PHD type zinc finger protein with BAH domain-containing protein [Tulasnella sp. UAMH 9824]|nr:putative PHD type zinc finger protein with BAH domain-containing protein [Tulasnella sp. UAMH 9824]
MPPNSSKEYITISNGEKVHVNDGFLISVVCTITLDHVYVSPPWELRDGLPYSIARIMEFLPAENTSGPFAPSVNGSADTTGFKGKGKEKEPITRVRLAWYYRPSDLSDRAVADSRLLFAAIFSEIQPVAFLRAKCHVKHKDKIADLSGWKKRPDRFYFSRLFDPYIKKEYEVIRSADTKLNARPRLRRPESVQCDICKHHFHMQCVQPPLAAKPAKGYGWTCAPCTLHNDERVDRKLGRTTPPTSRAKGGQAANKAKGKVADGAKSRAVPTEDKYFKMWPYRYFGLHTFAEDTLDPDDMIFPRAATRIGPKYQSSVPQYTGPAPTEVTPSGDDQLPARGGDSTIELLGNVVHMTADEVAKIEALIPKLWTKQEQSYSVDYLEEAIRKFSDAKIRAGEFDGVKIRSTTRPRKWQKGHARFVDPEWTPEERQKFERGLENYNAELHIIAQEMSGRTTSELVRFYGRWKNERLGEENRKFLAAPGAPSAPPPTKFRRTVSVRSSTDPDDEGSVINGDTEGNGKNSQFCSSCKTRDATVWWKGPKGLSSSVMCETCGIFWRKYGDIKGPPKPDEIAPKKAVAATNGNAEKREGTPLVQPPAKKQKPMPPPNKHGACACCRKVGLAGTVVKCQNCNLVVHASAYGVSKADAVVEPWLCEVCANEKHQEFALITECLLCPRPPFGPTPTPAKGSSGEFLRAWKPTEGRGWVHAICSIFIPEIQYTDATELRYVEGMSSLPAWRWTETALQMYCRNYKQVPLEHSYGLLRRAYRLDQALAIPPPNPAADLPPPQDTCCRCGTTYSPFFWPASDFLQNGFANNAVICQKCKITAGVKKMDVDPSPAAIVNGDHGDDMSISPEAVTPN